MRGSPSSIRTAPRCHDLVGLRGREHIAARPEEAGLAGVKLSRRSPSSAVTPPTRPFALLRARRERPRRRRAAEQRNELAAPIKKTRSHGTIAKRVGLAKRPRSAKGKRSMAGTPQPREPLGLVLGLG